MSRRESASSGRCTVGGLLLLVVALAGCAPTYPIPQRPPSLGCNLVGLDRVDAHLLRSSQPDDKQLACVRDSFPHEGPLHVFKLNRWWENREPKVAGVVTHLWPLDAVWATEAQVNDVVTDMLATCYQPGVLCLVHCSIGCDRTGLLAGLMDLLHGKPIGDVMATMILHCFHPYPALWRILLRYAHVL